MADIDLLAALERVYAQAERVIGSVRDDQWSAPSPCSEWDVRQVVEHLIGTVMTFTNSLADGGGAAPDGDDPAELFREAAAQSLAAWRQPGAMERTLKLPWGETPAQMAININLIDTYQHTWDVAKATGQPTDLDPEVGEYGRAFTGGMIGQMGRGGMFGEEVPVGETAPPADRLAAFLGRDPS